jgi:phosphoribosylglycinamide formyltransferase-1
VPVAVLASGRGSNFKAILEAIGARRLDAEVVGLVSDRADARALEIAAEAGIRRVVVEAPAAGTGSLEERRARHELAILDALAPLGARFLVLAGYMRIMSPVLIGAFRSPRGYARITNVHPSLLPAFPGVHSYGQAFRYGAQVSGVTVHLVDEKVDHGPICAQRSFAIGGCRSEAEVEGLGLKIEHELYPETLRWVLPERFDVETLEGRLRVRPN